MAKTITYEKVLAQGLSGGPLPLYQTLLMLSDSRLGRLTKKAAGLLCNEDYAPPLPDELFPLSLRLIEAIDRTGGGRPTIRQAFYALTANRNACLLALTDHDAGLLTRGVLCSVYDLTAPAPNTKAPQSEPLQKHLEKLLKSLRRPVRQDILDLQANIEEAVNLLIQHGRIGENEKDYFTSLVLLDCKSAEGTFTLPVADVEVITCVLAASELINGDPYEDLNFDELLQTAKTLLPDSSESSTAGESHSGSGKDSKADNNENAEPDDDDDDEDDDDYLNEDEIDSDF